MTVEVELALEPDGTSVEETGEELKMRCKSLVRVVLPDDDGPERPIILAILSLFPSRYPRGLVRGK